MRLHLTLASSVQYDCIRILSPTGPQLLITEQGSAGILVSLVPDYMVKI